MSLWMKIGASLLLITMFVVILPRAKQMLANSPKGSMGDWLGALIPIGLVVLFILVLISFV
jgi:cobalamin synthase